MIQSEQGASTQELLPVVQADEDLALAIALAFNVPKSERAQLAKYLAKHRIEHAPSDRNANWQTIETAPKDGSAFAGSDGKYVYRTRQGRHYVKWPHEEGGPTFRDVWSAEDSGSVWPWRPTHWTPLPALTTTPEPTETAITPDWCLNMARLEGDAEIGAGAVDHPLRCPPQAPEPTEPAEDENDGIPGLDYHNPDDDEPAGVAGLADEAETAFWQWWNTERKPDEHEAASFRAGFRAALRTPPLLEVAKEALETIAQNDEYPVGANGDPMPTRPQWSAGQCASIARAALQAIKGAEQ